MSNSFLNQGASMRDLTDSELDLISGGTFEEVASVAGDTVYCKYDSGGNREYCWTQKNDC